MTSEDVRGALLKKKLIIGSRETIKYLKNNQVNTIMISKNCPENIKKELEKLANTHKAKFETFEGTSKQFGVFLGKPFPIATVSIKSESK